jgi:NAD(P)-dependent dehydrogenase (short-subunit alcohol dehydrogenase family)
MDFFKAQFTKIPQINPVNLSNSTILITGANAGIGFEAAREILKSKPKRLILAVRSLERGNSAASELAKVKAASTEIDVRQLDQSSFSSVKAFADGLNGQKVDVAILNAGTWSFKWSQTGNGYETDLQVNVLSPALLSLLLLPNLRNAAAARATGSDSPKPHLSFVSSGLAEMAKFPERKLPQGDVLPALNDQSKYNGADRYSTTKLIGLLWAKEFAKVTANDQIVVNAPNPGFCRTSLMKESSGIMKYMVKAFSLSMGRSPEDGAKCVVDGAIVKGDESHGKYLSEAQIKDEAPMARGEEGAQLQKKMWDEIVSVLKKENVYPESVNLH